VTARTRLLLKIALALLILLGARQLWVAADRQVSSTGAGKNDSRPALGDTRGVRELAGSNEEVLLTSTPQRDDDVYDAVDFYGNEVTAAVATYKLDGSGALYELHSPQTELPQLPPPKS
jgi:hypothetical protein